MPVMSQVLLADGETSIPIDSLLRVTIQFNNNHNYMQKIQQNQKHQNNEHHKNDKNQKLYKIYKNSAIQPVLTSATVDLHIIPLGAADIIIGLPDIIQHFTSVLVELLTRHPASPTHQSMDASLNLISPPWTQRETALAPEDLSTPLPVQFPYYLHYMELSYSEAVQEYMDLLPTHVHPDFAASTEVLKLLRTKGVQVFVPQNWEGIKIPPLELTFKTTLPQTMKPKLRHVNPKLLEHAKLEFDRLCAYLYVPSDSEIASNLVIAPKATKPFIRFCGDYVAINKHIEIGHYPIPHVVYSLEKIRQFKVFLDLDWANSFHQVKLATNTSKRLSILTQWGLVRPLFMPEGIGPASGILQRVVSDCFADFGDWSIAIFDNLLLLAHDYQDAYMKLQKVLDRCIEKNIYLKFSKTYLGFDSATFFGYSVRYGHYELTQDRKDALSAIPFPKNTKAVQSFLGSALFFKAFIPHYSTLTAPLSDMTHKDFDWNPKSWKSDYQAAHRDLLAAIQRCSGLHYPDYTLDWILRTDASLHGVGAVLLQCSADDAFQPLGFASEKFSDAATRWSTIEQEAYAIYFAVKHFSYFLRCKPFVLETDHANLLWMDSSLVPKIIRWKIYLQDFDFLIRHIAGKSNSVADWLSRVHEPPPTSSPISSLAPSLQLMQPNTTNAHGLAPDEDIDLQSELDRLLATPTQTVDLPDPVNFPSTPDTHIADVFRQIHNARVGHHGARRTWKLLNRYFPAHQLTFVMVRDLVELCPVCQKTKRRISDTLPALTRPLHPTHVHSQIGIDTLTVSPTDSAGHTYLAVIVNHFTKLVDLYPLKDKGALSMATAIFQHIATYGLVDTICTDPGTEFQNSIVHALESWLGIRHRFSIVDRHESNGVERTNGRILELLRDLVTEERVASRWSSPDVLSIIKFILNSEVNSETGFAPHVLHFGTSSVPYHVLPANAATLTIDSAALFVTELDKNLHTLRSKLADVTNKRITQRRASTAAEVHKYQPGDLVLFRRDTSKPLPSKLSTPYAGPYEVISHVDNTVSAKHVTMGNIKDFHVDRLKLYLGDLSTAKELANTDNDQYVISKILTYAGDPQQRSLVDFEVEFADGSVLWLPFSTDISATQHFEEFCRSRSELQLLLLSSADALARERLWRKSEITLVTPNLQVYVDLRSYGPAWYLTLALPDHLHRIYLLPHTYGSLNRTRKKINLHCPLFNETYLVDNVFVQLYGLRTSLPTNDVDYRILDTTDLETYPQLRNRN